MYTFVIFFSLQNYIFPSGANQLWIRKVWTYLNLGCVEIGNNWWVWCFKPHQKKKKNQTTKEFQKDLLIM